MESALVGQRLRSLIRAALKSLREHVPDHLSNGSSDAHEDYNFDTGSFRHLWDGRCGTSEGQGHAERADVDAQAIAYTSG